MRKQHEYPWSELPKNSDNCVAYDVRICGLIFLAQEFAVCYNIRLRE